MPRPARKRRLKSHKQENPKNITHYIGFTVPAAAATAAAALPSLNLPAIFRPVLAYSRTAQRSTYSRCFQPSVSRPAVLPKLNLRGRWTIIVSRKWMSGQAVALVSHPGRRQFTTFTALRKLPSAGEAPFSIDPYLSWMSPVF
jgi:hypothetical protein